MTQSAAKQPPAKVLSTYELMERFPDEQSAIDYLSGILWQDGVVCPYCNGKNVKDRISKPNFYHCNACHKDFSIRVGTIFHRSHIPLKALKLLEKCLKDKVIGKIPHSVKMAVENVAIKGIRRIITFQYGDVTIFAQLVEERFPKWRHIVPESRLMYNVTVRSGELKTALKSIAPSFSKDDPHVDLVFAGHHLTLNAIVATSPYNGAPKEVRGTVEISCNGSVTGKIGVNSKFLLDVSSAFSDDVELCLYLPPGEENDPLLLEVDGGYSCVMMTLRDSVGMPAI